MPTPTSRPDRLQYLALIAASMVVVLITVAIELLETVDGYFEINSEAAAVTGLVAGVMAQHTGHVLQNLDLLLENVGDDAQTELVSGLSNHGFDARLKALLSRNPQVGNLFVLDAQGRTVHALNGSIPGAADPTGQHYFSRPRDEANTELHIGLAGKAATAPSASPPMVISRRLATEDGTFLGVVAATIRPDSLRACCRAFEGGGIGGDGDPRGGGGLPTRSLFHATSASLIQADGTDLLGSSGPRSVTGSLTAARLQSLFPSWRTPGSRTVQDLTDPQNRTLTVSLHAVPGYPLVAVAVLDRDTALDPWRTELAARLTGLLVLLGLTALLGRAIRRRSIRQSDLERRREEELALFRLVLESLEAGVCVFDGHRRLALWNRRFLELRRIPPHLAAAGTPLESFVRHFAGQGDYGPGPIEQLVADHVEALESGDGITAERILADGTTLELRRTALTGGALMTVATEVTERRRRDFQLREQLERFRFLAERGPGVAIFGCDASRRLIYWNTACEILYGHPRAEALGQRLETLLVPPADRELWAQGLHRWLTQGHAPSPGEAQRWSRSGAFPVLSSATALPGMAGGTEYYWFEIDISAHKARELALIESESRFRAYAESVSDWFWETGPDHRFTRCSDRTASFAGQSCGDLLGRTLLEVAEGSPDAPLWRCHLETLARAQPFRDFICPLGGSGDRRRVVRISGKPVFDATGTFLGYRGGAVEVTGQSEGEGARRRLAEAVEQSPVAVVLTDPAGMIEYVNRRFSHFTGFQATDVVGRPLSILQSGYGPTQVLNDLWRNLRPGEEWRGELHNRRKDGTLYWELATVAPIVGTGGTISAYQLIGEDISQRRALEERQLQLAQTDSLTGLPSRPLALDRLDRALVRARREGGAVALLMVDLDHFRVVNDVLGHDMGNRLLVDTARRLADTLPESDTIARLGGDEFLVILSGPETEHRLDQAIRALLELFGRPVFLCAREFFVSASIGVTLAPHDGDDPNQLLCNAGAALHRAKANGRNTYSFFNAVLNQPMRERLVLESALREAVAREELELHYQPVVDLVSGRTVAAVAQVRWNHPSFGLLPSDRFLALAERSDLTQPISAWMLDRACRDAWSWNARGLGPIRVMLNLSASLRHRIDLPRLVKSALTATGLACQRLEIELGEFLLADRSDAVVASLAALGELGVRIAVSDFGSGGAALAGFRHLPITTLKLDRTLVQGAAGHPRDAALCAGIIALARGLDLEVIAEGAELPAQADFLIGHGCRLVQSDRLWPALPARDFDAGLAPRPAPESTAAD